MRIKVKLLKRKVALTAFGFPIIFYITIPSESKKQKEILTGFHSQINEWDAINALPKKKHPQYYELLDYLAVQKIKVLQMVADSKYKLFTYNMVRQKLLAVETGVFYEDGLLLIEKLGLDRTNKTALKNFNSFFPGYVYEAITLNVAQEYVRCLMATDVKGRKRKINGVNSYLSSLISLWKKLDKGVCPFSSVKMRGEQTASKSFCDNDLKILSSMPYKDHPNSTAGGRYNLVNYLLLCFYFGGCDLEVLARARYDEHVHNGRFEFRRQKGGSNVFVSVKMLPPALKILKMYDCVPYFVPLYMLPDVNSFHGNMSRYYSAIQQELGLSVKPYTKAPRYTFINRSRELLIDERICKEIVGHSSIDTHSVYKDAFSFSVRDAAHEKIINFEQWPVG